MSEDLKGKTAKGLFWGGLSNGLQQLLNLFFGLFLGRILQPTDYGLIGMLTIFVVVANALQESGFTGALVNKKDLNHKDLNAVFWFSTLMGTALYLILFCCAPLIADFYDEPLLRDLSRVLFLGFLLSSSSTAHNAVLFRNLMVKQRAMTYLFAQGISGTVGIILALNGMAYWGLAMQSVTHLAVQTILLWHFSPWRPTLEWDFRPLRGMIAFSSKILLTNLLTHINNNIFTVLLGKFYKPQVGFYTQANKWSYMGQSLITGMVSNVAQPVLAKVNDETDRQREIFRKMLRFTSFVAFPTLLGLALVAPEFIVITIKEKWLPSVPYLQILCLWGAFIPITTLFSNLIISRGHSNIFLYNTVAVGLLQIILIFAMKSLGIMAMLSAIVTLHVLWLFIWHYFAQRMIGIRLRDVLKDVFPFLGISILCMGCTYQITRGIENIYLMFIAKIIVAAALYASIMYLTKATVFRESLHYLFQHKKG